MAHQRPERDDFAGLAIVAALQSDPSGRTVHTGSNPLTPLLNGTFDMKRAAIAADKAFKQWDEAYVTEKKELEASASAVPPKPLAEQREELLAKLKSVDDAIIAEADVAASHAAASRVINAGGVDETSSAPESTPGA